MSFVENGFRQGHAFFFIFIQWQAKKWMQISVSVNKKQKTKLIKEMALSTKIIGSIAIIGILYSIIRLFESGTGGGSFENAFAGILCTVLAIFAASVVSIILNRKNLAARKEEIYLLAFTEAVLLLVTINKLNH